jgi:leucyl/phenylalanyl-tRNA--protein transferase
MAKDSPPLSPALILAAYAAGVFPMSESRDDPEVFWVDPKRRGIIPLDRFHISRSLARVLRSGRFRTSVDEAFGAVIDGCADRSETWINPTIRTLYEALHEMGHAHSIEVWQEHDLVGGVYGVTLGCAFFGESMFSRRRDASKVALAYLVDRLRQIGFTLFDTQFLTPHLASLGGVEVSRATYHAMLAEAQAGVADFLATPIPSGHEVVQRNAQTS